MREQLEKRLAVLRGELEAGRKTETELESRLTSVRVTLLRISQAIQEIEKQLAAATNQAGRHPA